VIFFLLLDDRYIEEKKIYSTNMATGCLYTDPYSLKFENKQQSQIKIELELNFTTLLL
jgi:hypothetical protein